MKPQAFSRSAALPAFLPLYLSTALVISYIFGRIMAFYIHNLDKNAAGLDMLLVVGLGWVLQIALVGFTQPAVFIEYFNRLCRLMFLGVLVLIPIITAHQFIAFIPCPWHALSVGASFSMMFVMHRKLLKDLHISSMYQYTWALLLLANAGGWIFFFNLTYHII